MPIQKTDAEKAMPGACKGSVISMAAGFVRVALSLRKLVSAPKLIFNFAW
jgi:hypothetical protein